LRLLFTRAATADLELIADFIAVDSPRSAEAVYWAIVRCAEGLSDFPSMGRSGRLPDTRELVVPSLPYLIIYRVDAEAITVLAVLHASRDIRQAFASRPSES
jgi:toxin ParE1/3/4